jgi:hypothetical protein
MPVDIEGQLQSMFGERAKVFMKDQKDAKDLAKLEVVIPEFEKKSAPAGFSLYYSDKAISQIRNICKQRQPIFVADEITPYIAAICVLLKCPFYGSSSSSLETIFKPSSVPLVLGNEFTRTTRFIVPVDVDKIPEVYEKMKASIEQTQVLQFWKEGSLKCNTLIGIRLLTRIPKFRPNRSTMEWRIF